MGNTKVQLQQGATKVSQGAASAAATLTSAAQHAASAAKSVASGAQGAARRVQVAAASANAGLRAGTRSARRWVAPRLENAADYTTSTAAPAVSDTVTKTVAPRVSAALRTTARQLRPEDTRSRSSFRSGLAWTALSAAGLAAAGAIGTMIWRRYRAAMAADSEPDTVIHSVSDDGATPGENATADEDAPAGEDATPGEDAPADPAAQDASTPEARPARSAR